MSAYLNTKARAGDVGMALLLELQLKQQEMKLTVTEIVASVAVLNAALLISLCEKDKSLFGETVHLQQQIMLTVAKQMRLKVP